MQSIVQHPTYGQIIYEEGVWTGKKTITINGVALIREKKNSYIWQTAEQAIPCQLTGSFVSGAKLTIGQDTVELSARPKWYETLCSVLIFALIMVWSNSIELCSIIPVIGGAIGGAISGAMAIINCTLMKRQSNVGIKLAIWLGMLVATFAICAAAGFVYVAAMSA